jgi:hypothetical protein
MTTPQLQFPPSPTTSHPQGDVASHLFSFAFIALVAATQVALFPPFATSQRKLSRSESGFSRFLLSRPLPQRAPTESNSATTQRLDSPISTTRILNRMFFFVVAQVRWEVQLLPRLAANCSRWNFKLCSWSFPSLSSPLSFLIC